MKRFSSNSSPANNDSKRGKYNLNDSWDDDPEIDDFLISTLEQCEKQNNTLLGYTTFTAQNVFCSTQVTNHVDCNKPSTSKTHNVANDLSEQLSELQKKLLAKEGEATILRSQLNQTKEMLENERTKRTHDINNEIKKAQQNADKYLTQLEFSKLEMANLKRKLVQVNKSTFDISINQGHSVSATVCNESKLNSLSDYSGKGYFSLKTTSDLETVISQTVPEEFFEINENDQFPEIVQESQRDEPYMGSLLFPKDSLQRLTNRTKFALKDVFPDVVRTVKSPKEGQPHNYNKILFLALDLMNAHVDYLNEAKRFTNKQTIREIDLRCLRKQITDKDFDFKNLCLFSSSSWCFNECAIQCRQSLAVISLLLPQCSYLQSILLDDTKSLIIEAKLYCDSVKSGKTWSLMEALNFKCFSHLWWSTITNFVKLIGQFRQGNNYVGFLSALCQHISVTLQNVNLFTCQQIYLTLFELTKQIVLTLPQNVLLCYLSDLFKATSLMKPFVRQLCEGPTKSNVIVKDFKGLFLFNSKCCTFEVFAILTKQALRYLDNSVLLNILQFISNLFYCNADWFDWLRLEENRHYDCGKQCFLLLVEIITNSCQSFRKQFVNQQPIPADLGNIIRISTNVLSQYNYTFSHLLECHTQFSIMFKNCRKLLLRLKDDYPDFRKFDVSTLEKLSLEESPSQG